MINIDAGMTRSLPACDHPLRCPSARTKRKSSLSKAHQLRQLGNVRRDPAARGRLIGDVHFHLAKSKSVRNGWTRALFAFQNHVDVGAIDAMVPRKSKLAALALNCGFQQHTNLIIVKYERAAAQSPRAWPG